MTLPDPEDIRAALKRWPRQHPPAHTGRRNDRHAGVMVPLRWGDDLECLLILRSRALRNHAGEIGYPGGRPEPEDADIEATAIREAREELGITGADVLGRMSSVPLFTSNFRLEPFVARIDQTDLTPDPGEVAAILSVGIGAVLGAPHIDAIRFTSREEQILSPVFPIGDHHLFGGTAHSFLELLRILAPLMDRPVPPLKPGRYTWRDVMPRVGR